MATVYLAHDLKHDRPVALKVLHPTLGESLGRQRFEREIRFAARLQHPHMLSVIDSGETDGRFWFTMPYVRGESLRQRLLREGPLPVDEAVGIIRQAAQALAYAHREGVVHRDIKPENILLTEDGVTLVADFGVARALQSDPIDGRITQPGAAVGTPLYMAPEQAMGAEDQDGRVDQYALAAVAFELLTLRLPVMGRTIVALMEARLTSPTPRVRSWRPEVPEIVDDALQQALALDPKDRFPSMTDFARALAPAGSSSGTVPILPPVASWRTRRVELLLALVIAVGVIGIGLATRRPAPPVPAALLLAAPEVAVPRLAVLPFEHQGDSADAYFTDGVNDAIRASLAALPGVEVIARASSMRYRGTEKSPSLIAQELGVQYLLTAVVRREQQPDGRSIVHLQPELLEVTPRGATASRWQARIDQPLTNVFQVQSEIASKVAAAMQIAIAGGARAELAQPATTNTAAYDAYLRAEARLANGSNDPVLLRESIGLYQRAVRLDSSFVVAWSKLSIAQGLLYYNSTPTPTLARDALASAQRAIAIAPASVSAHLALADYYRLVALDPAAAAREFAMVRRIAPANVAMLAAGAANARSMGRHADAVRDYRAAIALNPRIPGPSLGLAITQLWLRRYREAAASAENAAVLAPYDLQNLQVRAMIALAQGDLAGARGILAGARLADPAELALYVSTYWDMGWMLAPADQAKVLALGVAAHDGDAALHGFVNAQLAYWRGDQAAARRWAASAEQAFAAQLREVPNDGQRHVLRALMLAYLGRAESALEEVQRGIALEPPTRDAVSAAYYQHLLARVHLLLGQKAAAIDVLERLLRTPYFLSAAWLRIDPTWEALRDEPRFQALTASPSGRN